MPWLNILDASCASFSSGNRHLLRFETSVSCASSVLLRAATFVAVVLPSAPPLPVISHPSGVPELFRDAQRGPHGDFLPLDSFLADEEDPSNAESQRPGPPVPPLGPDDSGTE